MEAVPSNGESAPIPKNGGKLSPEQDTDRRKCLLLKRKCDSVENNNKKLLNRIYHVRKTISRLSRERRGLMKKLDELKDSYKTLERTTPLEDGPFMYLLGFADQSGQRTHIKPAIDPRTGFPVVTKPKIPNKSSSFISSRGNPPTSSRKKKSRDGMKADKEKDPNAPKKPANAFLMFCQEKRLSASQANKIENRKPEMSHADLTKQLAKQWNDLEEKQKKRYYVAYEREKAKYVEEVRQYSKDLQEGTSKVPPAASIASDHVDSALMKQLPADTALKQKFSKEPSKLFPTKTSVVGLLTKEQKAETAEDVDPYSFDGD